MPWSTVSKAFDRSIKKGRVSGLFKALHTSSITTLNTFTTKYRPAIEIYLRACLWMTSITLSPCRRWFFYKKIDYKIDFVYTHVEEQRGGVTAKR